MSVPVFSGGWWYVTSTVEGSAYPIHHRGPTADDATRDVLLDENVEAEGHDYFDVGAFDLSHDHMLVAWSFDTDGDEHYTLHIRDLSTGEDRVDHVVDVCNAGTAWSRDGSQLFYVTADDQERPYRVWRHEVGAGPAGTVDTLVFEESDERYFLGLGETRSDDFVIIQSASKTSTEMRLLSTDDPTGEPILVAPRRDDVEYSIDHWGDRMIMHTNLDAIDFRILIAPTASDWTDPSVWSELVPHETGRRISGADPFAGHLVIHEWADAQPRLRIVFHDGSERTIELGAAPHDVDLSSNPEWNTALLRFGTQSTTVPPTLYDEDVRTAERTLLKQAPTPNVDLGQYRSTRLWADASDGAKVPIDIVHHVDTVLDGTAPSVVYGYGAYEASMPPWFSVARLSLLDRGFVWALVHPRGGGEFGSTVVPRRQARVEGEHVHRHHRLRRASRRRQRDRTGPGLHPGRLGGRPARRCLHHDAPRPVRQRRCRSAVRRRRLDDERPVTAAHDHRMGGVGRPAHAAVRIDHRALRPVRQHGDRRVPGDLRDGRPQRSPGQRPRAGQVDGPAPVGQHQRPSAAPAHRDGCRPWRPDRPLRRVARRGPHARLHPRRHLNVRNIAQGA